MPNHLTFSVIQAYWSVFLLHAGAVDSSGSRIAGAFRVEVLDGHLVGQQTTSTQFLER